MLRLSRPALARTRFASSTNWQIGKVVALRQYPHLLGRKDVELALRQRVSGSDWQSKPDNEVPFTLSVRPQGMPTPSLCGFDPIARGWQTRKSARKVS